MIRALVVDDDRGNRDYLKALLEGFAPDVEVVQEASNIAEAHVALKDGQVDLVFLDVEMPGGSGFDLLRQLGTWPFKVIFTTAFHRYAIQAIRFSALDYLLKPVQTEELVTALDRFRTKDPDGPVQEAIQKQFIHNIGQEEEKELKLTLTNGDRSYFVAPVEVGHCSSQGNYTELHLADGRRFISARTLKEYEEMLGPWGFLRIHRHSLVNCSAVSHLREDHVVMKCGSQLEVSRRKRVEVMKALTR